MRLPVEPDRRRRGFPSLTDGDLAACSEVSMALLTDPRSRALAYSRALAKVQQR